MAKQWAKLYRGATLREPLVELAQRNKLAFGLYFVLCAEADDFGRFTAHPAKFGHQIGGLIGVGPEEAEAILTDLEECGLIQRYEVDGEPFLAIIGYNDENEHQWLRMSGPEYPAPPGWVPPASFVEFVRKHGHLSNVTPKRYALRPGISPECDELIALMSGTPVGTPAVTDVGTPAVTPVGTPVVTGMGTDSDSDSDSDSGTDSTAFNDVRLGPDVDLNQESVPSPKNPPRRQSDSNERLNDPFGPPLRQTTAEGQPPAPDGADASPAPSGNDSLRQRGKGPTYEEIMATFSEDERRLVNEALDLLADWRPDGSRLENARQFVEVRDLAPAAFARVLAEGRRVDGGRGPKTVKYYRQIALAAASAPPEKWPKLRAAIGRLNMPPHTQDNWVRVLGNAVEGAGDKWVTSEDQIVALLAEYPPKAAEENLPVKWLERVEKARGSGSYAVPHTWVGGEWEALGFKVYQPRNETPEEGDGSEAATPAQEGRCAGFRHLMDEGVDANAVLEAMGFRVCRPKAPEEEEAPQSTTPEKKAQHETKTPEEGIVFDLNDFRPKTEGARDSPDLDAIQWDEPEGLEFDENGDEVEDWDEIEDDDYEAAQ